MDQRRPIRRAHLPVPCIRHQRFKVAAGMSQDVATSAAVIHTSVHLASSVALLSSLAKSSNKRCSAESIPNRRPDSTRVSRDSRRSRYGATTTNDAGSGVSGDASGIGVSRLTPVARIERAVLRISPNLSVRRCAMVGPASRRASASPKASEARVGEKEWLDRSVYAAPTLPPLPHVHSPALKAPRAPVAPGRALPD